MRDTLGSEGIAGVVIVLIAVGVLTVHDPIVGAGVMVLLAGLALIAKGRRLDDAGVRAQVGATVRFVVSDGRMFLGPAPERVILRGHPGPVWSTYPRSPSN